MNTPKIEHVAEQLSQFVNELGGNHGTTQIIDGTMVYLPGVFSPEQIEELIRLHSLPDADTYTPGGFLPKNGESFGHLQSEVKSWLGDTVLPEALFGRGPAFVAINTYESTPVNPELAHYYNGLFRTFEGADGGVEVVGQGRPHCDNVAGGSLIIGASGVGELVCGTGLQNPYDIPGFIRAVESGSSQVNAVQRSVGDVIWFDGTNTPHFGRGSAESLVSTSLFLGKSIF